MAPERTEMFTPPRSLFDLLKNLHDAFDRGLVLKDEFYSEENLKALSGANEVDRRDYEPGNTRIWMSGSESLYEPVRAPSATYPSMQYRIDRNTKEAGKSKVSVFIAFQDKQPYLKIKEVEVIFGTSWAEASPIPLPPTWPFGTKDIRYLVKRDDIRRSTKIRFRPDGTLSNCKISQEAN